MGLGKALKKAAKQLSSGAKKATAQLSAAVKDAPDMFNQIGQIGALPLQIAGGSITAGLSAAAPVLEQATGLLQANPALAGMLQTGLTGGGWNLGSLIPQAANEQAQPMPSYVAAPAQAPASPSVPVWVWIAAGAAALLGLVLVLFRRKG